MLTGDLDALVQFGQRGVGHNVGDFGHVFVAVPQNQDDLVIDSILFDGTTPINQHHIRAILGKFGVQLPCFYPPWSCVLSGWFFLAPMGSGSRPGSVFSIPHPKKFRNQLAVERRCAVIFHILSFLLRCSGR